MSATGCFVGIDVSKATFDIAISPSGEQWSVENDDSGMDGLTRRLQELQPSLVLMEASGGKSLWRQPWPSPAYLCRWSTHAKCATLPGPWAF